MDRQTHMTHMTPPAHMTRMAPPTHRALLAIVRASRRPARPKAAG